MAIEGPLRELGIHDVFQLLDLSRKTGMLSIQSQLRLNRGRVYFDRGAVVYAEVDSNPHPLGSLLVRAGKIAEADLERARDMQEQGDDRRLGEILVAIGAITRQELDRQVRRQLEEVIFEILSWSEGHFSFVEGTLEDVPAEATIRISTESLLMEGARRIDEWSRIESRVPHLGIVPALAPLDPDEEVGRLDLLPSEWEVVGLIDGATELRQIAHELGRSEFDVAKTVFGLESAGIVTLSPTGEQDAAEGAPEGELAELAHRVETGLGAGDLEGARHAADLARTRHSQEAKAYVLVGRVSAAQHRIREAEEDFRRALRLDPQLAPAHRLLGDSLARQGRLHEAVEWWSRWLTLGEEGEEAEQQLARVREAVRAAEALETLLQEAHA